jgi:hypothetical protein
MLLHVTAGKFIICADNNPHSVAKGISLYKSDNFTVLINWYCQNNNNNKLSLWLFIPWSTMFHQAYDQAQSDFLQTDNSDKYRRTPVLHLFTMKTCMHLKCNNLNRVNSFASSFNAYRPKHIVLCNQIFILAYLEKYFDKQPESICDETMRRCNVSTNWHGPWWCSRGSIGVFGKSNRDLEYAIF